MGAVALARVVVGAEEVLVVVVAEVAAVPGRAAPGEALDAEVVVGRRREATRPGHALEEALGERDRRRNAVGLHLGSGEGGIGGDVVGAQLLDVGGGVAARVGETREPRRRRAAGAATAAGPGGGRGGAPLEPDVVHVEYGQQQGRQHVGEPHARGDPPVGVAQAREREIAGPGRHASLAGRPPSAGRRPRAAGGARAGFRGALPPALRRTGARRPPLGRRALRALRAGGAGGGRRRARAGRGGGAGHGVQTTSNTSCHTHARSTRFTSRR